MQAQLLAPASVLVLWSVVMLVWVGVARLPPLSKRPGGLAATKPGGRGQDLEGVLPDSIQWKSHNYTHLMEQPTLFYAVVGILAIVGGTNAGDVAFAWGYVALRIVHSIYQSTVNKVTMRFTLFILSTICLVLLAIHAFELTALAKGTM